MGNLSKSSSFLLLCITPVMINTMLETTITNPISQGKTISMLRLFT